MVKTKTLLATFAALMTLQTAPVLAENHEVNLTRKGRNVYKLDGKDIIIQTRCCYVYTYSASPGGVQPSAADLRSMKVVNWGSVDEI